MFRAVGCPECNYWVTWPHGDGGSDAHDADLDELVARRASYREIRNVAAPRAFALSPKTGGGA